MPRLNLDSILIEMSWAASWQNQQNNWVPNEDSDQPVPSGQSDQSLRCALNG